MVYPSVFQFWTFLHSLEIKILIDYQHQIQPMSKLYDTYMKILNYAIQNILGNYDNNHGLLILVITNKVTLTT